MGDRIAEKTVKKQGNANYDDVEDSTATSANNKNNNSSSSNNNNNNARSDDITATLTKNRET